MGWVLSALALGYALFQAPGGWLADRLGARLVLSLIVTIWSIFTGLTSLASNWMTTLGGRFLFGAGEAGAFPGIARAVYSCIPMTERGLVQGINFSGSRVGAALALPLVTLAIQAYGWKSTFLLLMLIGFGWALAWMLLFRDEPSQAAWLPPAEREWIVERRQQPESQSTESQSTESQSTGTQSTGTQSTGTQSTGTQSTELRSDLDKGSAARTMGLLCAPNFASNFTFFFGITWFFPQLQKRCELTAFQASMLSAVPMLFGALGNWVSGWWADRLYRRGHWVASRRYPAMLGFLISGMGVLEIAPQTSPLISSIFFSLCIFGADMTLSPSRSTCIDIGKREAGLVSGTMNMAGNLGSFVTSLAFPYLLAWTGTPLYFFFVAAGLICGSIWLWLRIAPTRSWDAKGTLEVSR
jgi:ACS family glucarate transporter-like MFS transporter